MQLLVGSTFEEIEPRLSQDGRRLVFASRRSGDTIDIWMAEADGSAVQLLSRRPSRIQGSPYWSPDRRVVCRFGVAMGVGARPNHLRFVEVPTPLRAHKNADEPAFLELRRERGKALLVGLR